MTKDDLEYLENVLNKYLNYSEEKLNGVSYLQEKEKINIIKSLFNFKK